MRNLPEWPVAFFGCLLAGGIAVLLNAWWTGPELRIRPRRFRRQGRHCRSSSGSSGCSNICRIVRRWSASSSAARPKTVAHPQVTKLEDRHRRGQRLASAARSAVAGRRRSIRRMTRPSSTRRARPASRRARSARIAIPLDRGACASVRGRRAHSCGAASRCRRPIRTRRRSASLLVVPLFHATGCHRGDDPVARSPACKLVFMRKWDPELAMQLIERERITNAGGVPTIAWQLLEHPALRQVRSLLAGKHLLRRRAGGRRTGAAAEGAISQVAARHRLGHDRNLRRLHRTSGRGLRAAPGELRRRLPDRRDEDRRTPTATTCRPARSASSGSRARSWCRAIGTSRRPRPRPSSTAGCAPATSPGSTTKAFVYIVDRAKDMLIRGGENIYCVEVENALYEHPGVIDAAVVGIPHRSLGEEPAAVVALKHGASVSEAGVARLRRRAPRRLQGAGEDRIRARTLPRNPDRQDDEARAEATIFERA